MSNFWSLIVFGVLFTLSIVCLQAGSTDSYEFKTKPIQMLDDELRREFLKPNRWGYSVLFFPQMNRYGYTYSLDLMIKFRGVRLKSIPEIEELHADIYGEILSKLNSIKNIRPFLANFPLSPDTFALSIGFDAENGGFLPPPNFVSIIMREKTLEFNRFIKDRLPVPFETALTKSIGDSELLRRFYKCKIDRKPCVERPVVPKVSYIFNHCSPCQHALFEFAEAFAVKNNLNFVGLCPAESQFKDKTPFNMILWGTSQLTKDSARKLAAECAGEFLQFVQNDKRTLCYMVEISKNTHINNDATFPEACHLGFRISFWDENIDRQPEPYISEIRLFEGKFKYFTVDDGQRLVLVHEETFDEAQAFLKSLTASR